VSASQVSFSLTGQPGYAGTNGNLDGDPAFVDPAGGDFHLQTGSLAIDAGSGDGASSTDLECRARVGPPDMGAFEFGGALATCPPPGTTVDAHPPSSTQEQSAAFSFESDIAASTFECKLDSGAFAACTSPESYSGLTSGQHVFEVRAVDPDGDWDPDPAVFSWTITETTPPVGAPTISGFSPGSAGAHSTVTVAGTGFTGATSVLLNGTSVSFGVASNTRLTFTVPAAATSGAITIVTPVGSATSTGSLTVAPPPTITAISPSSGPAGTPVTITGTNLQETVGVEIGHVVSVPTSIALDGTELTFTIPPGAATGAVRILARNGSAASADVFTVTG
jgi:IPT/TIG domain